MEFNGCFKCLGVGGYETRTIDYINLLGKKNKKIASNQLRKEAIVWD